MFAIATPAKQSAEEAIVTLSGRLSSSTLLEDRRAAILGLKSFASGYPATVSSNALRGLIGCLNRDVQDIDTAQAILQTLLLLFSPNQSSPEASEDIALWLADEFTQRQENITLLLDLLDTSDFYSRLNSLKLLSAILSARVERTKECISTAPLGISKLVVVLDDKRDAVRNEALSLLTYLTINSIELQKRVAFEDAFDRIFNIIRDEGSLLDGDRLVEDCLILLANLLRLNESNQSFFREAGHVRKIANLLGEAIREEGKEFEVSEWTQAQRNRNTYALLAVLRLFLVKGGTSTKANQTSFWHYGVLDQALKLAFSHSTEPSIKAEALITCADLIRGNPSLQEGFAQFQVTSVIQELTVNEAKPIQKNRILQSYVVDALLDLTLNVSNPAIFDVRMAACECIKAYFVDHPVIRKYFLQRVVDGHTSGIDNTANVLTTLLKLSDIQFTTDPYRIWFAAVIFYHLIFDNPEAKNLAMKISEGDAANGEELVTCLQTLTGNLIDGIKNKCDERILVAYLMILCGWLFEDQDSVNDLLGEGSHLRDLVQAASGVGTDDVIIQGLCATVLGIIYEFSTKDSPIPRSMIHQVLKSQLGRDKYSDRLSKLRSCSLVRDFEVLPQNLNSATAGDLPEVFFDQDFIDFLKDNFSRILRTIDRDPGFEVPVITNGTQKGISREMVDSLRSQLEERNAALQKSQETLLGLDRRLNQEQADHRKTKEIAAMDLEKTKQSNEMDKKHYEEQITQLRIEQDLVVQRLQQQHDFALNVAQNESNQIRSELENEIRELKGVVKIMEEKIKLSEEVHAEDLKSVHDYKIMYKNTSDLLRASEEKVVELEIANTQAIEKVSLVEISLTEKTREKQTVQEELDDLLMVFADMEDKVSKYKKKLRAIGEAVSDAGEDDDGEVDNNSDDA
ncbi:hypothetical protein K3495_g4075 [Podosphaera aphanis]|nr:hypothetical protein K3495_g4075 [Podosphaera aphanis]